MATGMGSRPGRRPDRRTAPDRQDRDRNPASDENESALRNTRKGIRHDIPREKPCPRLTRNKQGYRQRTGGSLADHRRSRRRATMGRSQTLQGVYGTHRAYRKAAIFQYDRQAITIAETGRSPAAWKGFDSLIATVTRDRVTTQEASCLGIRGVAPHSPTIKSRR